MDKFLLTNVSKTFVCNSNITNYSSCVWASYPEALLSGSILNHPFSKTALLQRDRFWRHPTALKLLITKQVVMVTNYYCWSNYQKYFLAFQIKSRLPSVNNRISEICSFKRNLLPIRFIRRVIMINCSFCVVTWFDRPLLGDREMCAYQQSVSVSS